MKEIYQKHGFKDRTSYLESLVEDYGDIVWCISDLLGSNEDFDGLITSLEDAEELGYAS